MLDKIILGFLSVREFTSYDLMKGMEQSTNFFYSASLGSINPALQKLLKEETVTMRESIENNRLKKFYSITPKGEVMYKEWLTEPIQTGRIKDEALVRLFFLGDANEEEQIKLLEDYLFELRSNIDALENLQNGVKEIEVPSEMRPKAKFQALTLQYGIDYYKHSENWFRDLINQIKDKLNESI